MWMRIPGGLICRRLSRWDIWQEKAQLQVNVSAEPCLRITACSPQRGSLRFGKNFALPGCIFVGNRARSIFEMLLNQGSPYPLTMRWIC